jgi:hypothetical protein
VPNTAVESKTKVPRAVVSVVHWSGKPIGFVIPARWIMPGRLVALFQSVVLLLPGIVAAQVRTPETPPKVPATPAGETPRQQLIQTFEQRSPAVGSPLPELSLLDANGAKFPMSALRGHYSVLVFGCLT